MSKVAEDFDSDLAALIHACLSPVPLGADPFTSACALANWIDTVQKQAEVMEVWIEESDQDPRSMGWVDDRGRP